MRGRVLSFIRTEHLILSLLSKINQHISADNQMTVRRIGIFEQIMFLKLYPADEQVIPELIGKFGKNLKVWSAACSTGDEPYSLVMAFSNVP